MAGLVSYLPTSRNAVKARALPRSIENPPFSLQPAKAAEVQSWGFVVSAAEVRRSPAFTTSQVSVRARIKKQETLRHGIGIFGCTNLRTLNTDSSQ